MEKSEKIARILQKKYGIGKVDVAIVVGSGLYDGLPELKNKKVVDYEELGMAKSRVKGHNASFVFGEYAGKNIVLVSRLHYYERGDIDKVKLPLRVVSRLGTKTVILLTSSGALNKSFNVCDIMLIKDHINMSGVNPLVAIDNLSFTNMVNCYDEEYRAKLQEVAKLYKIDIKEGVFCQMSGPSYETVAEIEMLSRMGGDSVSMSTAHDCIIARYLDMKVLGISIIVNIPGDGHNKVTHAEVLENASKISIKLKKLLEGFLSQDL